MTCQASRLECPSKERTPQSETLLQGLPRRLQACAHRLTAPNVPVGHSQVLLLASKTDRSFQGHRLSLRAYAQGVLFDIFALRTGTFFFDLTYRQALMLKLRTLIFSLQDEWAYIFIKKDCHCERMHKEVHYFLFSPIFSFRRHKWAHCLYTGCRSLPVSIVFLSSYVTCG